MLLVGNGQRTVVGGALMGGGQWGREKVEMEGRIFGDFEIWERMVRRYV
jgi:hypothetical protein